MFLSSSGLVVVLRGRESKKTRGKQLNGAMFSARATPFSSVRKITRHGPLRYGGNACLDRG